MAKTKEKKKPEFGTPEWMTYIRGLRGKKGHTHKKVKVSKRKTNKKK